MGADRGRVSVWRFSLRETRKPVRKRLYEGYEEEDGSAGYEYQEDGEDEDDAEEQDDQELSERSE